MALYLVQHGKSLLKEIDPDQGISEEGRKEVEKIANISKDKGILVSCIKHSGKKRARQAAEIFASYLHPKEGIQENGGMNPLDDVTVFAPTLNSRDNLMLYAGWSPAFHGKIGGLSYNRIHRHPCLQITEWRHFMPRSGQGSWQLVDQVVPSAENRIKKFKEGYSSSILIRRVVIIQCPRLLKKTLRIL